MYSSNLKAMADKEVNKLEEKKIVLHVLPQRIQKRRLQDIQTAAKKRKIDTRNNFCDDVTHIVTEYSDLDQVEHTLKCTSETLTDVNVLSMKWFTDSMKAGKPVTIEDSHRLVKTTHEVEDNDEENVDSDEPLVADWACQRVTPLKHHNEKFTSALEVIQKHAELRDGDSDYSRALAFRRASCVLKSLPFRITDMGQLSKLKDIGNHCKRVIKEILEDGFSTEVDQITNDRWFLKMKIFSEVFGIGPSTAKRWIEMGFETVEDAKSSGEIRADWRVQWGLAFHSDLITPVLRQEADIFYDIVKCEAEAILPGVIVEICGGFKRGKATGHDIDILLTHPEEGREHGLLPKLLRRLDEKKLILCGNLEKSTYNEDVLTKDFKLTVRGQLDHFEKWMGIVKLSNKYRNKSFKCNTNSTSCYGDSISKSNILDSEKTEQTKTKDSTCAQRVIADSMDDYDNFLDPRTHLKKLEGQGLKPQDIANSDRDWLARRVDLVISPYSQFYYALVGWIGSKHFNRDLRLYSQRTFNMKLTSHGLYDFNSKITIPAESEQDVFDNLKLSYKRPWERNC